MSPVQPLPPYSAPQPEAEAHSRNKAATPLLASPTSNTGVSRLTSPQFSNLVKRSSTLISGNDSVNEQDVPGLKRVKASSHCEIVRDNTEEDAEDMVKPEAELVNDGDGWPVPSKKTNLSTEAGKP